MSTKVTASSALTAAARKKRADNAAHDDDDTADSTSTSGSDSDDDESGSSSGSDESDVDVPEQVMASLDAFDATLASVEQHLNALLPPASASNSKATSLATMTASLPPIESAKLYAALSYSLNSLFFMYLRAQGVDPQQHPITKELERVKAYLAKVSAAAQKQAMTAAGSGSSSSSQRSAVAAAAAVDASPPSRRVDRDAANRFISAALGGVSRKRKPSNQDEADETNGDVDGDNNIDTDDGGEQLKKKKQGSKSNNKKSKTTTTTTTTTKAKAGRCAVKSSKRGKKK